MRGRYSGWERTIERIYFGDLSRNSKEVVLWKAKLRMEFVNEGKESIILIAPNQEFRFWKSKSYFSTQLLNDTGDFVNYNYTKEIAKDSWSEFRREKLAENLPAEEPPPNVTIIIKPGDSITFNDTLQIEQGFEKKEINGSVYTVLEGPTSEPEFEKNEKGIPISKYDKIKIKYELSFLKIVDDVDFMEKLQTKWRKFGYLPVNADGIFSITSEVLAKG